MKPSIAGLLAALKGLGDDNKKSSLDDLMPDKGKGTPIAAKLSVTTARPMDEDDMADDGDEAGISSAMKPFAMSDAETPISDDESMPDDEQDPASDPAQDAKIVDVLQDRFPEIFDEITKQLEHGADDETGEIE